MYEDETCFLNFEDKIKFQIHINDKILEYTKKVSYFLKTNCNSAFPNSNAIIVTQNVVSTPRPPPRFRHCNPITLKRNLREF